MRQPPQSAAPEVVYSDRANPFVTLYHDRLVMADGSKRRYNRVVEHGGRPGVVIMPLRGDAIGMVEQYRYPVDAMCLELPRGFGEGGSALYDARRELREETGLAPEATAFVDLGEIHPDSGLLAGSVRVFAAHIADDVAARIADVDEVARFRWVPCVAFEHLIADGVIRDAFTLATAAKARARGLW